LDEIAEIYPAENKIQQTFQSVNIISFLN
jgi:hypothetical protein